jgi:transcriptional regulator with XRE-family HTH domain
VPGICESSTRDTNIALVRNLTRCIIVVMKRQLLVSRPAQGALTVLGQRISMSRRERRWTAADLAKRAHISVDTLRKIESGEPTVMIGSYFEVATLLGVELWEADHDAVERYKDRFRDRLALLPARVRPNNDEIGVR